MAAAVSDDVSGGFKLEHLHGKLKVLYEESKMDSEKLDEFSYFVGTTIFLIEQLLSKLLKLREIGEMIPHLESDMFTLRCLPWFKTNPALHDQYQVLYNTWKKLVDNRTFLNSAIRVSDFNDASIEQLQVILPLLHHLNSTIKEEISRVRDHLRRSEDERLREILLSIQSDFP
jgi:hypothetical protein